MMDCLTCGVCCMHMAQPPFVEAERKKLPAELQEELAAINKSRGVQFKAFGADFIPCAWFDMATRKCRHYEHRPEICREFPVGGPSCRRHRSHAGLSV